MKPSQHKSNWFPCGRIALLQIPPKLAAMPKRLQPQWKNIPKRWLSFFSFPSFHTFEQIFLSDADIPSAQRLLMAERSDVMASWLVWQLASARARVLFPSLFPPIPLKSGGFLRVKKGVEWIHHMLHLLMWFNYTDRQRINRNVHVGTLTNGLNCNCLQITGREHQYWHRRDVGAQKQSMRGLSGLSRWRVPTSCLTKIYSLPIHREIIVFRNINAAFCATSVTAELPNCSFMCWVIRSGLKGQPRFFHLSWRVRFH